MYGRTHTLIAVNVGLACASTVMTTNPKSDFESLGFLLAGTVIGSYFPDIDHPNSPIRAAIRKILTGHKYIKEDEYRKGLFGHRGIMHTLIIYLAMYLGMYLCASSTPHFLYLAEIGFIFACVLHILVDTLNPTGSPLLWPVMKINHRISIAKIHAGGMVETIIFYLLIPVTLFHFYYFFDMGRLF